MISAPMRVALISDLHANLVALDAVLADIERVGVDRIVCLGDVATLGPEPNAIFERLDQLGCLTILGNHDEFLLDEQLIHSYTEAPVVVQAVDWCRARTTKAELDFVKTFQTTAEITLADDVQLLVFHGSPRSHMENLLATTPPDELEVYLDGRRAAVLAGGHTHIQMTRQHRGMLLVNPGSSGMPFVEFVNGRAPTLMPHAEYATVEAVHGQPVVTMRRVSVDRNAVRRVVQATDNPLREMLLTQG
jgi:putative phosphoesterase